MILFQTSTQQGLSKTWGREARGWGVGGDDREEEREEQSRDECPWVPFSGFEVSGF